MKFLSIYKTAETGVLPTQEEMARMGKLVEDGMKAGFLLAVEGCMPSATGARAGCRHSGDIDWRRLPDAGVRVHAQPTS